MKLDTRLTWIIRSIGMMSMFWGVAMLIANGSSPDPIDPTGCILSLAAGVLLLWIGYAKPSPGDGVDGDGATDRVGGDMPTDT
jgi:threonine/homoserine efflux transporter RhtA